jgi:hypothetical protein
MEDEAVKALMAFWANPVPNAVAIILGTFIAFSEVFLRGKPIPALSRAPVQRGAPAKTIFGAFCFCVVYGGAIAVFLFASNGGKQYFLSAGAAVQTLANIRRQR